MFSKRALLGLLSVAAIIALMVAGPAWSKEIVPAHFEHQTGDLDAGWYWLRDEGDSAVWTFDDGREAVDLERRKAIKCSKLEIPFVVLVPQADGSGHDKSSLVLKLASAEEASQSFRFDLHQRAMLETDDAGIRAGYTLRPTRELCQAFKKTGKLSLQYVWKPTAEACCKSDERHTHPVAVSEDLSVKIVF